MIYDIANLKVEIKNEKGRTKKQAIPYLATDKSVNLFERQTVMTKAELESRVEINYENYSKTINIEAKTMIDMAGKQFIPSVIKYTTSLADSITKVQTACPDADVSVQTELLKKTSTLLASAQKALATLEKAVDEADTRKRARNRLCSSARLYLLIWRHSVLRSMSWR